MRRALSIRREAAADIFGAGRLWRPGLSVPPYPTLSRFDNQQTPVQIVTNPRLLSGPHDVAWS